MQAEQSPSGRLISKSILILTFTTLGVPVFVFLWLEANNFARKCFKKNLSKMPSFFKVDLDHRFYLTFDVRFQMVTEKTNLWICSMTGWLKEQAGMMWKNKGKSKNMELGSEVVKEVALGPWQGSLHVSDGDRRGVHVWLSSLTCAEWEGQDPDAWEQQKSG